MSSKPVIFGALAASALLVLAKHGSASGSPTVPNGSGGMRQATVSGRSYSIFSLGEGEYLIISNAHPPTWLDISQTGELDRDDGGEPALLETLRTDMKSFPPDLFSA